MKRLLILLLISIFILPSIAVADCTVMIAKKKGSSCDYSTNEVGDRTSTNTGWNNMANNEIDCFLYQADCSGTLRYAWVDHQGTGTDDVKIGVFTSQHGSTVHSPDSGDTLVGSWSTGDTVSTDTFIQLSGTIGGSVTSGNWYWVCALAGPNALSIAQNTSGTRTLYYNSSSSYSSPPSTLSGTWSSQASRDWGLYVEIQ